MSSCQMLIFSRPTVGNEAAYNDWYTNQHLAEVVSIPGFISAQRFIVADLTDTFSGETMQYAAIYEIECEQLTTALAALTKAVQSGEVFMSDALDRSSVTRTVLRPLTERLLSS
jgi:voltage-gated potassium channel Kch